MGLDVRLVDFDCVLAPPVGSVKLVGGSLHSPAQAESIDVRFSRIHPGIPLKRVPVLRVFGVTRAGQKTCVHVHQAFPYLYVRYDGPLEPPSKVLEYAQQLGLSINHALALAYNRSRDPRSTQYVMAVIPVKGIPFYGYHGAYQVFLKVYLLDPNVSTKLADLLISGAVMGHKIQAFEYHTPFLLQFLIDYNLYGMGFVEFAYGILRAPILRRKSAYQMDHADENKASIIATEQDARTAGLDVHVLRRQSTCEIELDCWPWDILNRDRITERPGEPFLPVLDRTTSLVHSLQELWDEERRRLHASGSNTSSNPAIVPPTQNVEREALPETAILSEFRRSIRETLERSGGSFHSPLPRSSRVLDSLMTAYESAAALYPEKERQEIVDDVKKPPPLSIEPSPEFKIPATPVRPQPLAASSHHTPSRRGQIISGMNGSPFYTPSQHQNMGNIKVVVDEEIAISQRCNPPLHHQRQEQTRVENDEEDVEDVDHDANEEDDFSEVYDDDEDGADMLDLLEQMMEDDKDLCASQATASSQQLDLHSDDVSEVVPSSFGPAQRPPSAELVTVTSSFQSSSQSSNQVRSQQTALPNSAIKIVLSRSNISNSSQPSVAQTPIPVLSASQHSATPCPIVIPHEPSPFARTVSAMWSPLPSEHLHELERPSFIFSPPRPGSPSTVQGSVQLSLHGSGSSTFRLAKNPPCARDLLATTVDFGLPDCEEQAPYFSDPADVVSVHAGRAVRIASKGVGFLREFESSAASAGNNDEDNTQLNASQSFGFVLNYTETHNRIWTLAVPPIRYREARRFLIKHDLAGTKRKLFEETELLLKTDRAAEKSQIEGPTLANKYGFKYDTASPGVQQKETSDHLTILSVEVHVNARGDFLPDPAHDAISAIFFCIQETDPFNEGGKTCYSSGCLMVSDHIASDRFMPGMEGFQIELCADEQALLDRLIDSVIALDPDILLGYEIHNGSWGYIIERAAKAFRMDLCERMARIVLSQSSDHRKVNDDDLDDERMPIGRDQDAWGFRKTSMISITGRVVLNVWRLMRSELDLTSYTLETMVWHVLHQRVPKFSHRTLTSWYCSSPRSRIHTLRYYSDRARLSLELLDECNVIGRTSEFARVYGVQFYAIISRGSQYKVESMMMRIAKPESFIMVSPSRQQVYDMRAMESLPLVMEPPSGFYTSPVVVLDFQSLYPSVMIAYNYCYSTCLGKFVPQQLNTLGFTEYQCPSNVLKEHLDDITVSPNGVAFVKPHIRQGVLRKMLTELLNTRIMVKESMKRNKHNKTLYRILDARQLGLKLISNVTYGYTAAGFSGRMPCVEVADSIVQTGRATLERAIDIINSHPTWNARVIYADTDSTFVLFPGSTKERAFAVGRAIAEHITNINPRPVKLKFEKVYHPCVLLTKKRYVGFKYEYETQLDPDFDAKGIETVRRDGCPVVAKTMESALKYAAGNVILFRSRDLSEVKAYLQRQWMRILTGRVSLQDFIIAKAVRLGTYSERGLPPPGAYLSLKNMRNDPRREPQYGERVPYIIAYHGPDARLVESARSPEEFAKDESLQLHATYYITKQIIPVLARVFDLIGVNVSMWYSELPRVQRTIKYSTVPDVKGKGKTIEQFYQSRHCLVCDAIAQADLCGECAGAPQQSILMLNNQLRETESKAVEYERVCATCTQHGFDGATTCISIECPVYYERTKAQRKLGWVEKVRRAIAEF